MQTALIIIHVIISIILIATVLMQHGNQQGISGAIAGGAETFFGKNKGRTIDAMLKKVTAVVAVLFIVSSVVLAVYSIQSNKADTDAQAAQTEVADDGTQATLDENGNLVDAEGNILMTAEDMQNAQNEIDENADADAETAAE